MKAVNIKFLESKIVLIFNLIFKYLIVFYGSCTNLTHCVVWLHSLYTFINTSIQGQDKSVEYLIMK